LLLGAAVGLKLTNVVYALGAAAAVLAATRPLMATICLGLGGAVGALATGGAWGLMLWREMGNPIFPLFNAVFQSKELVPMNIMDWRVASWTRWPIPSIGWSATTGARSIRFAMRGLRSRWC
jgi:hypothetical protein